MGFFIKKKNLPEVISDTEKLLSKEEVKCEHKFQDFPWYIDYQIYIGDFQLRNKLTYEIKEPYVCIHCGFRQDKVLERKVITGKSKNEMDKILQKVEEQYSDRIKPKPIIEDMVNDFQLVDIEHLRWYHYLNGTEDPSTSRSKNQVSSDIKLKL